MIGYVTLGVSDLEKAKAFYCTLLSDLGVKELLATDRLIMLGSAMDEPMIAICIPYDEQDPHPGNGNMVALNPGSKEKVDELHARALELGGSCEGKPGDRVPGVFYGAYVRDPDGNKLAFYQFS